MSLQARITLSVAAAVAVILAAFGYSATWAIRESTSTVLRDRLQIAEIVADQVAVALMADRAALEGVARELSGRPRGLPPGPERFAGLAVVAADGRVLWSRPGMWPAPVLRDLVVSVRNAQILAAEPGSSLCPSRAPGGSRPSCRLAPTVSSWGRWTSPRSAWPGCSTLPTARLCPSSSLAGRGRCWHRRSGRRSADGASTYR